MPTKPRSKMTPLDREISKMIHQRDRRPPTPRPKKREPGPVQAAAHAAVKLLRGSALEQIPVMRHPVREVRQATRLVEQAAKTMRMQSLRPQRPSSLGSRPSRSGAVSTPATYNVVRRHGTPRIEHSGQAGTIRIHHKEYVRDVSAINGLWSYDARVNPTNELLFTYLPGVASNFEVYKFLSLSFEYVPMCGTGSVGNIHMAIDADPDDPPPQDKQSLMAMDGAVSLPAWTPHMFHMPRRLYSQQREYFIRNNSPSDAAAKFYDCGRLVVLSQSTSAYSMGELYVHYTIELRIPQVHPLALSDQIIGPALPGRASSLAAAAYQIAVNGHVTFLGSSTVTRSTETLFNRPNRFYLLFVLSRKGAAAFTTVPVFGESGGATRPSNTFASSENSGFIHRSSALVKSSSYPSYLTADDGQRITYYGSARYDYAAGDVAGMEGVDQTITVLEIGSAGPFPPLTCGEPAPLLAAEPVLLDIDDPEQVAQAYRATFPLEVSLRVAGGTTIKTFRSKGELTRYIALSEMEEPDEDK